MPDNAEVNCILEVCCGKDGKQLQALTKVLRDEAGLAARDAQTAAAFMITNFDFMPKGTTYDFKQKIAELARGEDYK